MGFYKGVNGVLTPNTARRIDMTQKVSLVSAGTSTSRADNFIRVYVDLSWRNHGRVFTENLFTVIE